MLDDRVAAEAAEQRFRETTTAMGAVPAPAGPPADDDLKSLFRDAAKRMHPDLMPDDAGRAHAEAFMKRLNQAYKAGDAEGHRQPRAPVGDLPLRDRPSGGVGAVPGAARRGRPRRAPPRRAHDSDLARFMEQSFQSSMAGRDLFLELRQDAEAALGVARARFATSGSPRKGAWPL